MDKAIDNLLNELGLEGGESERATTEEWLNQVVSPEIREQREVKLRKQLTNHKTLEAIESACHDAEAGVLDHLVRARAVVTALFDCLFEEGT